MNDEPETTEQTLGSGFPQLTRPEVRVLGCLMEKSVTTPENYPLSLNTLISACNQKSSRDPVVAYTESTVEQALDALRDRGLATRIHVSGSRVAKYKYSFERYLDLLPQDAAVLCALMLRGPQTCGELRSRTERMYKFAGVPEVDDAMKSLASGYPYPLVGRLPRESGKKERRYLHLLCGDTAEAEDVPGVVSGPPALSERVKSLEDEVEGLRGQVEALERRISGNDE